MLCSALRPRQCVLRRCARSVSDGCRIGFNDCDIFLDGVNASSEFVELVVDVLCGFLFAVAEVFNGGDGGFDDFDEIWIDRSDFHPWIL